MRADGAFEAIVSRTQFAEAQTIIRERFRERSIDEKLDPLRRLLKKHGYLSVKLIDQTPWVPAAGTYARWFGSLPDAYRLVGFNESSKKWPRSGGRNGLCLTDEQMLDMLRKLWKENGYLTLNLIDHTSAIPSASSYHKRFGKVSAAFALIGYLKKAPRGWRPHNAKKFTRQLSEEEMLQKLRQLLHQHGHLRRSIIDEDESTPSVSAYKNRFGSLAEAYKLIGFMPRARTFASPREIRQRRSNYALLQGLRRLLQKHGRLSRDIINNGGIAGSGAYVRRFGSLTAAYSLIGYAPDWLHGRRARRSILFD